MKYLFKRTEPDGSIKEIEAIPERWVWAVLFQDNTEMHQFGEDGIFHQLKDIDQTKIKLMVLYKYDEPEKRLLIPWQKGRKLNHKYINVHADYFETMAETVRVYCFGYKDGKRNHYTYILPNDQMIYSAEDNIDLTKFKLK